MYTVKEVKKHKWRFACPNCGNETVELKMWCAWDKARQQWVYTDDPEEDYAYCSTCADDFIAQDVVCEEIHDVT